MSNKLDEVEIVDNTFKDITKKVAKIEMSNIDYATFDDETSKSLVINTFGEYKITIVFYTGINVMRAITENMRKGKKAADSEINIYIKEYFNIFCGRVITTMNNITKMSAKFSVPNFIDGIYSDNTTQYDLDLKELYYSSDYGPVKIQVIH